MPNFVHPEGTAVPASEPDIYIRGGLCAPKHVAAMGEAVWLYFHLHKRVRFDGEGAGETMDGHPYRHADAADALGVSVATVKRWFARLEAAGYVTSKRLPYGLVVRITKYERASSRAARRQMRSVTSEPSLAPQGRSVGSEPSRSVSSEPEIAQFCTPDSSDVSARSVSSEPSLYKDARGTKGSKETNDSKEGGAVAPAPKAVRGNQKVAAVIDGLRAADLGDVLSGYDKACVAKCDATAEAIVEAFGALTRGEWGSQWVRDNASIAVTANNIGTYLNLKRNGAPPPAKVLSRRPPSGQDYLMAEMRRAQQEREEYEHGPRRLPGGSV